MVVALTMLSACGESSGEKELVASFSASFAQPSTGPTTCPVTAVHFDDRSTGAPTAWQWRFPDGSRSSERNPTWKTSLSVAEVTLTVRRGDESDSVTKMISTHSC